VPEKSRRVRRMGTLGGMATLVSALLTGLPVSPSAGAEANRTGEVVVPDRMTGRSVLVHKGSWPASTFNPNSLDLKEDPHKRFGETFISFMDRAIPVTPPTLAFMAVERQKVEKFTSLEGVYILDLKQWNGVKTDWKKPAEDTVYALSKAAFKDAGHQDYESDPKWARK
jgi:hypothetical protein